MFFGDTVYFDQIYVALHYLQYFQRFVFRYVDQLHGK